VPLFSIFLNFPFHNASPSTTSSPSSSGSAILFPSVTAAARSCAQRPWVRAPGSRSRWPWVTTAWSRGWRRSSSWHRSLWSPLVRTATEDGLRLGLGYYPSPSHWARAAGNGERT
jgi:hypothetical protein